MIARPLPPSALGEPEGDVIEVRPDGLPPIPLWSRRPLALAGAEWLNEAELQAPRRCNIPVTTLAHSVSPVK